MNPFTYTRAENASAAVKRIADVSGAEIIAGGTDMIQLLQERVRSPLELVDVNGALADDISESIDGVRIGALAKLADVADDPMIRERFPVVAEALRESASPQVRNVATMAGNLLQRTRCLYFRDVTTPCNKREPGSGCPAQDGQNRINAVLGGSTRCIAAYPGDLAVALVALDAEVMVTGPKGERTIRVEDLHRLPGDTPQIETVLERGEVIEAIFIPLAAGSRRSHYLKVRDRSSFEWAIASAAVALAYNGDQVFEARIAVGGVATKPWRLPEVETMLVGKALDRDLVRAAAALASKGAQPRGMNAFKVPLIERTVERALLQVGGVA
jgi:xanthine dehydrogenase YagS FAD-binding subunit